MKRFRWPLQRVLEVTVQREKAVRSELFDLARQVVMARQEVVSRRAVIRGLLSDLGRLEAMQRLARQTAVMGFVDLAQKALIALEDRVRQLDEQRKRKTQEFIRIKQSRETLERLRSEALGRHLREMQKLEQKHLDESASVAFARRMQAGLRSAV